MNSAGLERFLPVFRDFNDLILMVLLCIFLIYDEMINQLNWKVVKRTERGK